MRDRPLDLDPNLSLAGYEAWLQACEAATAAAARLGPDDFPPPAPLPDPAPDAPVALLCSPHPDDEVITGALPYRLRREGWRVVNLAITLGSRPDRRAARRLELEACCARLGFELQVCGEEGLEDVRLEARRADPAGWSRKVGHVAAALAALQPRVVLFPHAADQHATHQGVYGLARQALLRERSRPGPVWCVETEFWAPMVAPNLMVAVDRSDLVELLQALRCHTGEVVRNPYHLRLPAWMIDNVRRGSELLGGAGTSATDFAYATLYRAYLWLPREADPGFPDRGRIGSALALSPLFDPREA